MEAILKALTWHHLIFVFATIFIVVFRLPLGELIKRITKITKDGLTANPSPESQHEKTDTSNEAVQQLLDVVGNSIVINELEENIKNELTSKGLDANSDVTKVLIKHLSGTQLLLEFERIHSLIFGSQIFFLKKLNEVSGQGKNMEFVTEHIQHTKNIYKKQLEKWDDKEYLNFLYSRLLILKDNEQIHITNKGIEYLTWLARNGRREDNPL